MKMIGRNLPATPVPSTVTAEFGREQLRVREDRDERSEGGRGERDGKDPPDGVDARRVQDDSHGEADRERGPQLMVPRRRAPRGT